LSLEDSKTFSFVGDDVGENRYDNGIKNYKMLKAKRLGRFFIKSFFVMTFN